MDGDEQRQNKFKKTKQHKNFSLRYWKKIKNQSSAQNMARSKQYNFFLEFIGF